MSSYYSSYDDGEMALASGYGVGAPGCRGRDLKWADGTYYGKAPAMIVDLKAAARYLRYTQGMIPGNFEWIITSGGSAGGALSALPAAAKALGETLTAAEREAYLKKKTWITWSGGQANVHLGQVPRPGRQPEQGRAAFDAFDLSATENSVYGNATHNARHFTLYSLRHATGNQRAELDRDLPTPIAMMNPLYHLCAKNPSRARHWWIRTARGGWSAE
jgi:hypothetical protein